MSNEKSCKEIGATIGAFIDLASYAHSKLSDSKPVPSPVQAARVAADSEQQFSRRFTVGFCALVACIAISMGIAALLSSSAAERPVPMQVCQFAPGAQPDAGASGASTAAAVPLNAPCRIPYNDGMTPGERFAGHAAKLAIFSLL